MNFISLKSKITINKMNLINKNNLFQPIKNIWDELEYKNLDIINSLNLKLSENKLFNDYDESMNNGIFHSVNYYENIKILNIFGFDKKKSYLYYLKNLKNDFALYGIKSLKLNKETLIKIFYQLNYFRCKFDDYETLDRYINNNINCISSACDDKIYDINILLLVKKKDEVNVIEENDSSKYIYYPKNNKEKLISSSIFFNENSLKMIEKQNLDNLFKFNNQNFHQLVNIIHENFDYINKNKIMIFSSIVLETIGLRKANDIDMYIHNLDEINLNKAKILSNLEYLEYKIKNTELWPSHWNVWLDNWARQSGAKYFEEILCNQKFHYYFLGIKIISLNCDIVRRVIRERPAAFCDLIMINKKLNLNIKLPKVPKYSFTYKKIKDLSEEEQIKFKEQHEYDEENKEFILKNKIDENKFLNTISNYCKYRYEYNISQTELISLLNKKKIRIKKSS